MATGTKSNARQANRIPTNTPVTLLFEFQGQQHRQRARLLDISDTGMRLKTSAALVKGQEVDVLSQHGMQEPERTRVVWVTEADPEPVYCVGVESVNPHQPGPAVLPSELAGKHAGTGLNQPDSDTRRVVGDDRGPLAKQ